jgi:hypothetical protein
MKHILYILCPFITILHLGAQNFIGMNKDDISKYMTTNHPDFKYIDDAVNKAYKYMKYVDHDEYQTWLFFLSEDEHCTVTKLISDYVYYDRLTATLDKNYKKEGTNTWTFRDQGVDYIVELKKDEWFFSIITKKK